MGGSRVVRLGPGSHEGFDFAAGNGLISVLRLPTDGLAPACPQPPPMQLAAWASTIARVRNEHAVCAISSFAASCPVCSLPSANPRCSPAGPRPIRKGEVVSMDYSPDKLDGPVLLDYGVMDTSSPKVGECVRVTVLVVVVVVTVCGVLPAAPRLAHGRSGGGGGGGGKGQPGARVEGVQVAHRCAGCRPCVTAMAAGPGRSDASHVT